MLLRRTTTWPGGGAANYEDGSGVVWGGEGAEEPLRFGARDSIDTDDVAARENKTKLTSRRG